jgi:hypothetical protein
VLSTTKTVVRIVKRTPTHQFWQRFCVSHSHNFVCWFVGWLVWYHHKSRQTTNTKRAFSFFLVPLILWKGVCGHSFKQSIKKYKSETKQHASVRFLPIPKRGSMELAKQIGTFVGTSVLLYWVTTPKTMKEDDDRYNITHNNNNNNNSKKGGMEGCEDPRQRLRGIKKYSSYHRKKMYASISKMSSSSILCSSESESSQHGGSSSPSDNSSVYSLASSSIVSNEDAASR